MHTQFSSVKQLKQQFDGGLIGSADLRYEVDKLNASQRLDLNLEKGRIQEDLQK